MQWKKSPHKIDLTVYCLHRDHPPALDLVWMQLWKDLRGRIDKVSRRPDTVFP